MHPDERTLFRRIGILVIVLVVCSPVFFLWFLSMPVQTDESFIQVTVEPGDSVSDVAERLEDEGIVRSAKLFSKYLALKGIDKKIQVGIFTVEKPLTLAHIAAALIMDSGREEKEITILPGWDVRDMAAYFEKEGIASADEVIAMLGKPATDYRPGVFPSFVDADLHVLADKPEYVGFEAYVAPETYRIFADATLADVFRKLILHRDFQFTDQMYSDIKKQGRSVFDVLTMASIVEREVQSPEDKAKVADLFWDRLDQGWPLQADSTVHYIVGTEGSVFTSQTDRSVDSPWNTYKYAGLPLGPISTPSLETIMAVIYPEDNPYTYFLTDSDGVVHYAKTLDEHNANRVKFIR